MDLPIPGSPPKSTKDPATIPPPKTLSNSETPEEVRLNFSYVIWESGFALPPVCIFAVFCVCAGAVSSSTIVLNLPQEGQRPSHLGLDTPHSEQTNSVVTFAIVKSFLSFKIRNTSSEALYIFSCALYFVCLISDNRVCLRRQNIDFVFDNANDKSVVVGQ